MPTRVFSLASLTGRRGFAIVGDESGDGFGFSVASAGDVNADGIDDLIINAPFATEDDRDTGDAYVIYGVDETHDNLDVTNLTADDGFWIRGNPDGGRAVLSVAGAGDVNGDGIDDMIIGDVTARPSEGQSGAAYVIYGQSGTNRGTLDLGALSAQQGFTIAGAETYTEAGRSVAAAGDVNGDGLADVIVGAPSTNVRTGAAYVIFGQAGQTRTLVESNALTANPGNGFLIIGDAYLSSTGWSVNSAGDVNGDGIDDVIVGALNGTHDSVEAGRAFVVYGTSGARGPVDLGALPASAGFALNGIRAYDQAGGDVASAGDVNGDGIDDLIIGARFGDSGPFNGGEAYVVFGVAGTSRDDVDLAGLHLRPYEGFVIVAGEEDDNAGWQVGAAGDVNADGLADLFVGAPQANSSSGAWDAGRAYVIYGQTGGFGGTLDLGDLSPHEGFAVEGVEWFDRVGHSVALAGDVNNDGFDDLVVGSYRNNSGTAYVVYGRPAPQLLTGNAGNNTLAGLSNDDTLSGLGGADLLEGLEGADSLSGGDGTDTLRGGEDTDTVYGGSHDDLISGDSGNDSLFGDGSSDTIRGGEGDDVIDGGSSADTLYGDSGADSIVGGSNNDRVYGGAGNDSIRGGTGNDTIYGGSNSDLIYGEDANDSLLGDGSSDTIFGGLGDDTIDGGGSADTLRGDAGADSIDGGSNADVIEGGDHGDTLLGGTGNDTVSGGLGDDLIRGGDGDDSLAGDQGADTIHADGGDDLVIGGQDADILHGGDGADSIDSFAGDDLIYGDAGNDAIHGGLGNDTVFGGSNSDVIAGEDGHDSLMGDGSSDSLYGGSGDDTLDGGGSSDTLLGFAGADRLLGGTSADILLGDTENDTLYGGTSADTVYGGSENDLIHGDSGDDSLMGDDGFDTVYGGDGRDLIDGGSFADRLYGGASSDTIRGGADDDTLYGGSSSDSLTGGTGRDVFVFSTGIGASIDTITDFSAADDRIWLEASVFAGLPPGALDPTAFATNTSGLATTPAHRLIYESDSGALWFDADGNGGNARVQFAALGTGLALTHEDFFVI